MSSLGNEDHVSVFAPPPYPESGVELPLGHIPVSVHIDSLDMYDPTIRLPEGEVQVIRALPTDTWTGEVKFLLLFADFLVPYQHQRVFGAVTPSPYMFPPYTFKVIAKSLQFLPRLFIALALNDLRAGQFFRR